MRVSAETLRRMAADLATVPCSFWACAGESNSLGGSRYPIYMKTCNKCWTVWKLRRLAEGKTEKQMNKLLPEYERRFRGQG